MREIATVAMILPGIVPLTLSTMATFLFCIAFRKEAKAGDLPLFAWVIGWLCMIVAASSLAVFIIGVGRMARL